MGTPAQNIDDVAAKTATGPTTLSRPRAQKLAAFLVTADDALWSAVTAHFGGEILGKQFDSLEELLAVGNIENPAIVLWDARGATDLLATVSRIQTHSSRWVTVILDSEDMVDAWNTAVRQRQVAAMITLPIKADEMVAALDDARDEVSTRIALLGASASAPAPSMATLSPPPKRPWIMIAAVCVAAAAIPAVWMLAAHRSATLEHSAAVPAGATAAGVSKTSVQAQAADTDDKLDGLIARARQAVINRHYVDPADGSALSLYREALILEPNNAEAHQGLQRVAEILLARVQTALDGRQLEVALHELESARSIDPSDSRLPALDARIATMRSELGPAQIQAAIAAQNFDKATQLIDEAATAKTVPPAKLNQLRLDVRRGREENDAMRFTTLIDARLEQDRLIDPPHDSVAYYLGQARTSGVPAATLRPREQEFAKRAVQSARAAIDQRRFADADRLLTEIRGIAPSATVAGLQHELGAARDVQSAPKPAADPQNTASPQSSDATPAQALAKAREPLDASQTELAPAAPTVPNVAEGTLVRAGSLKLQYPDDAKARHVEGSVDLEYSVLPDGSVDHVKVLSSSPPGVFDAAAVRGFSHLRYKPYLQGGKPITVTTKIRVTFRDADRFS